MIVMLPIRCVGIARGGLPFYRDGYAICRSASSVGSRLTSSNDERQSGSGRAYRLRMETTTSAPSATCDEKRQTRLSGWPMLPSGSAAAIPSLGCPVRCWWV